MLALTLGRSRLCSRSLLTASFLCPLQPEPHDTLHSSKFHSLQSVRKNHQVLASAGFSSNGVLNRELLFQRRVLRSLSTQAATAMELSAFDGLTIDRIVASHWAILDESESDWKRHAAAIAQSIQVIKKRLQLNKPDLWDDHVLAGRFSREEALEEDLIEHIDMIKLAREEAEDSDLDLYISLMFIGLLIVISVGGFLSNLMKHLVASTLGWNDGDIM